MDCKNSELSVQQRSIGEMEPFRSQKRRAFLKQVAIGTAAAVGTVIVGQEAAFADPPVHDLRGAYDGYENLFPLQLKIVDQNGNDFSGVFADDQTPIKGTITGERAFGDNSTPMTIIFDRLLANGIVQTFVGAVSIRVVSVSRTDVSLAGVFYHDGLGPYPWWAQGQQLTIL